MRLKNLTIATGLLLAAGAVPAHANLNPRLVVITESAGGYLWTYEVFISADQKVSGRGSVPTAGVTPIDETRSIKDYITWYDFGGFTGNVFTDPGYTGVSYMLGSTPERIDPEIDSADFPNITVFRSEEAGVSGPSSFFVSIESIFNVQRVGITAADATRNEPTNPLLNNRGASNISSVETPFRVTAPVGVPEPGTLLLMGAGLLGLGVYRRKSF